MSLTRFLVVIPKDVKTRQATRSDLFLKKTLLTGLQARKERSRNIDQGLILESRQEMIVVGFGS